MKKYFYLAVMALAGSVFMMTSCSDDDENNNGNNNNENPPIHEEAMNYTDGKSYFNERVFLTDASGSFGLAIGQIVKESEPTTSYVGVDSQEEATTIVMSLFPKGTSLTVGDKTIFTLTDTLGNKTAEAVFTLDNAEGQYGVLSFSNTLSADKKLTAIKFIDNSIWPENAPATSCGLSTGTIYRCPVKESDKGPSPDWCKTSVDGAFTFICTRLPKNGCPGILFHDTNHEQELTYDAFWKASRTEWLTVNYPSGDYLQLLANDMNSGNPIYWQQLAAITGKTIKQLKTQWYHSHHNDYYGCPDDVCLGTGVREHRCVYTFSGPKANPSRIYLITVVDGKTYLKLDSGGAYLEYRTFNELNLSDLTPQYDLMEKARGIVE